MAPEVAVSVIEEEFLHTGEVGAPLTEMELGRSL